MLFTFIGEGSGETIYDSRVIRINDEFPPREIQEFMTKWVTELDEDRKDQFGNLDREKVSIEEIVKSMPGEWKASITDDKAGCLFV